MALMTGVHAQVHIVKVLKISINLDLECTKIINISQIYIIIMVLNVPVGTRLCGSSCFPLRVDHPLLWTSQVSCCSCYTAIIITITTIIVTIITIITIIITIILSCGLLRYL